MDLAEARAAYDARAWARAHELYGAADALDAADLDRYAETAMLLGRMDEYFAIRERTYELELANGNLVGAAQAAFWAGMQRVVMGDVAVGGGWLSRAARCVEEDGTDSVPAGFLRLSGAFEAYQSGDLARGVELLEGALATGRRLGVPDLVVMALHQKGLALLQSGEMERGLAALDEAMLDLTRGEVSPMLTGIVYCNVIGGCWSTYELQRAQEWTAAMSAWVDGQPELRNFTGECKVRRAELKQLHGLWAEARDEIATVTSAEVDAWAAGSAAYVRGNLDRLQGRFESAEECYAEAAQRGIDPQPGLALLRLGRGSSQAALAMVRRTLTESQDVARRAEVLFAAVEVFLATGEHDEATTAVAELAGLAERCHSAVLLALHDQAAAAVALAAGSPETALPAARRALRHWLAVAAPYQAAGTRTIIASACRALGDVESADRETAAAAEIFRRLAAAPDLARLHGDDGPLSPRELDVLRMLATGATNRSIAERLVLSERTVDRHVSNIFAKLGISSRAAATAYAFERHLV